MADAEERPAWGQLVAGPALALRVSRDGGRTWEPYVMRRHGLERLESEPAARDPHREGEEG
ncbi:hypothetical protein ACWCTA_13820 [Streptomyces sp. NPDC001704]|uniref:hypothetical protein n=1 Tax=Streptomyces sp. SDr-06 TaxID=2267702 RepID=UPI0011C044C8|nr:hypothetical protein [Streptomyces sp. SDr-06]